MLVLSRKPGEKIYAGDQIEIQVVRTTPSRVVLCIKAPSGCKIRRMETISSPQLNSTHELLSTSH